MSTVTFKEFMRTIRAELEAAHKEMSIRQESALFELQQLELELNVLVKESKTKEGEAEVWILSGRSSRSGESETVQTVRLKYNVAPAPQGASRIGDRFHSSSDQSDEERMIDVLRK